MTRGRWISLAVGAVAATAAAALVFVAAAGSPKRAQDHAREGGPPIRNLTTTRVDLEKTAAAMEQRLARDARDSEAAVALADALLRQTRVTGNAGLAMRAESALIAALASAPNDYNARRMLAAVYLSQHRFADAIREARRCREIRSDDAWVYGVLGDAHIELGDYQNAFDAFDRMTALRPDAASYARASYARELQGDLNEALHLMQMAAEATAPQDPESLAWHHAQIGHLYLELGRLVDARREFEHADFIFHDHPFAKEGLARVEAARGNYRSALGLANELLAYSPTPAAAALAGDLLEKLGRGDEAERKYQLAEAAWRVDAPEPSRLARFLATHGRQLDEAIRLAEMSGRHDIFTDDALAWAYFGTGRIDRAQRAIRQALRTGTRDRDIRAHADAIERAASSS